MEWKQRIYCIEGQWNWGKRAVEPSVEPILQTLRKMGQWDYARRDCATPQELEFWIEHEWNTRCKPGSILYIASHGEKGRIWLTNEKNYNDNNFVSLDQLAGKLDCSGCLVHFGGCEIASEGQEDKIGEFMESTKASYVTGYSAVGGWTDTTLPPALALELMLFSSISTKEIYLDNRKKQRALRKLIDRFNENEILQQCGLRLFPELD